VVDAALDAGVNLIDTADLYGSSEELLGQVLQGRRDEVILATKFGGDMKGAYGADHGARASRLYVRRAVEGSLRRLRTDHIDLYQLHFPDGVTPLQETLAALGDLVTEGKVGYVGSSNLAAWQVTEADWIARESGLTRFVSTQSHYSLLRRGVEAELVPACVAHGIGLLPYFPLASGMLTGKWRRGEPAPAGSRLADAAYQSRMADSDFDKVESLEAYASSRGVGILEVAVGGLAAQPAVSSVIAGATRPEQVRANVAAGEWVPGAEDLAELDGVVPGP
ncbi:MAG: aldo/keto reductase, partial [Acidimicrobiales bacterium]